VVPLSPTLGGAEPVAPRSDVFGNKTRNREETLSMPRGFKPLHTPLPLAGRLVRILHAVFEIAILPMCHTEQELALRGAIALQCIRDKNPWYVVSVLEQLVETVFAAFLFQRLWARISRTWSA
jgi:hypothetical protein